MIPIFSKKAVNKVLVNAEKPLDLDELLQRVRQEESPVSDDVEKQRQRIHYLVYSGAIKAVPHPENSGRRLYLPPDNKAEIPAPAPAPAPTVQTPSVDLTHAVNTIAQAVATALEKAIQDRIAEVVRTQLQRTLDSLPAQVIDLTGGTVSPAKPASKPRVTVVGLLPGQVEMISREYVGLDLHFVGNEHNNTRRLEGLCRSSR